MELNLDLHIPNDDFALKFREGSNHVLILNLFRDGVADTSITGYSATLHIYDSINATSTYQIDSSSIDASAGTMTFNIAPGDLPPYRVYQGSEIVIKDGSDNPYFYAEGTVTVRRSILGSAVSALTSGLSITWGSFTSYVGTAASGPYRAGTNVSFSPNADGSQDINASSGTDADAIHDNVASEISAITEKASPVSGDLLVIEDSADSNNKKRVQIGNLPGGSGTDDDAIHDNVAGEIVAVAEKASPVDADVVLIEDSADSNNKKRVQIVNLPKGVTSIAIGGNDGIEVDSGSPVTSSGTIELGVNAVNMRTILNVEDGAAADQTDMEIQSLYESTRSVVSQAEAEAGVATTVRLWTAQRVAQAIAALGGGGGSIPSMVKQWEGYRFTANGGPLGAGSSPAPVTISGTNTNLYGAAYDDTTSESAGPFYFRVPDDVDNATDVKFHWLAVAGDTNDIRMQVKWAQGGDAALTTSAATFSGSTSTSLMLENTLSVDMTLTAGRMVVFYLERDPAHADDNSVGDYKVIHLSAEVARA